MKYLRFFIVISILVSSCNIINKDEVIPAFIQIDNIILNPGIITSAQHNITDVRLSVNGDFIGVFEVPTIIPVLDNGDVEISIAAGIQNAGMSDTRIVYPLTQLYETTLNLVPGETVTLEPVFTYFDDLDFDVDENFNGSNGFTASNGDTNILEDPTLDSSPLTDQLVVSLTPNIDENLIEITTFDQIETTEIGPTMLEFNYKANQNFVVGLKSIIPGDPEVKSILIGLNTSEDDNGELQWKKIYVNLEEYMDLFHAQGRNFYRLYFASETALDDPTIYLDNIKIIHL